MRHERVPERHGAVAPGVQRSGPGTALHGEGGRRAKVGPRTGIRGLSSLGSQRCALRGKAGPGERPPIWPDIS